MKNISNLVKKITIISSSIWQFSCATNSDLINKKDCNQIRQFKEEILKPLLDMECTLHNCNSRVCGSILNIVSIYINKKNVVKNFNLNLKWIQYLNKIKTDTNKLKFYSSKTNKIPMSFDMRKYLKNSSEIFNFLYYIHNDFYKRICQNCYQLRDPLTNKKCSKCDCVYYCSKKCQKVDWKKHHKHICDILHQNKKSNIFSDKNSACSKSISKIFLKPFLIFNIRKNFSEKERIFTKISILYFNHVINKITSINFDKNYITKIKNPHITFTENNLIRKSQKYFDVISKKYGYEVVKLKSSLKNYDTNILIYVYLKNLIYNLKKDKDAIILIIDVKIGNELGFFFNSKINNKNFKKKKYRKQYPSFITINNIVNLLNTPEIPLIIFYSYEKFKKLDKLIDIINLEHLCEITENEGHIKIKKRKKSNIENYFFVYNNYYHLNVLLKNNLNMNTKNFNTKFIRGYLKRINKILCYGYIRTNYQDYKNQDFVNIISKYTTNIFYINKLRKANDLQFIKHPKINYLKNFIRIQNNQNLRFNVNGHIKYQTQIYQKKYIKIKNPIVSILTYENYSLSEYFNFFNEFLNYSYIDKKLDDLIKDTKNKGKMVLKEFKSIFIQNSAQKDEIDSLEFSGNFFYNSLCYEIPDMISSYIGKKNKQKYDSIILYMKVCKGNQYEFFLEKNNILITGLLNKLNALKFHVIFFYEFENELIYQYYCTEQILNLRPLNRRFLIGKYGPYFEDYLTKFKSNQKNNILYYWTNIKNDIIHLSKKSC